MVDRGQRILDKPCWLPPQPDAHPRSSLPVQATLVYTPQSLTTETDASLNPCRSLVDTHQFATKTSL